MARGQGYLGATCMPSKQRARLKFAPPLSHGAVYMEITSLCKESLKLSGRKSSAPIEQYSYRREGAGVVLTAQMLASRQYSPFECVRLALAIFGRVVHGGEGGVEGGGGGYCSPPKYH